jgi:hypothetical protein
MSDSCKTCTLGRNGARRCRLYVRQNGKCYYCDRLMNFGPYGAKDKHRSPLLCTIEHLDDKYVRRRGGCDGKSERTVAACRQCNEQRGIDRRNEMRQKGIVK